MDIGVVPTPKGKKARKVKRLKTGLDVVQSVQPQLNTPEPPMMDQLPSYEDMEMTCSDLFNGPSSMETQPDLDPSIGEEGITDGPQVEWWPEPKRVDELENLKLQAYLMEDSKPLHTTFVLQPNTGNKSTCPVYFGKADQKQTLLNSICHEIHPQIQQEWGTLACECGFVPKIKLSQTARNPNKVFLSCPKAREAQCQYFQWIHQAPKPLRVTKASAHAALKQRMHDMVHERCMKQIKVEEGGFKWP